MKKNLINFFRIVGFIILFGLISYLVSGQNSPSKQIIEEKVSVGKILKFWQGGGPEPPAFRLQLKEGDQIVISAGKSQQGGGEWGKYNNKEILDKYLSPTDTEKDVLWVVTYNETYYEEIDFYSRELIDIKKPTNSSPLKSKEFIDISGVYFGKYDKAIFNINLVDNFWKVKYIAISSDGSFLPRYPFELHPTEDPTRFVAKNIFGYGEGEINYPTEFKILQHSKYVILLSTPINSIKTIKQDKLNIDPMFPHNIEGKYTGKYGNGYIIEKVGSNFFYSEFDYDSLPSIKHKLKLDLYTDGNDIYFYSSTYKDLTVSDGKVVKYFRFFEREGQSYLVTKEDWDLVTYVYQKESDSH